MFATLPPAPDADRADRSAMTVPQHRERAGKGADLAISTTDRNVEATARNRRLTRCHGSMEARPMTVTEVRGHDYIKGLSRRRGMAEKRCGPRAPVHDRSGRIDDDDRRCIVGLHVRTMPHRTEVCDAPRPPPNPAKAPVVLCAHYPRPEAHPIVTSEVTRGPEVACSKRPPGST